MSKPRALSRFLAFLVIVIGGIGLAGWLFSIPAFKTVFPGLVAMKFNTSLCFIALGSSLLLLQHESAAMMKRRTAQILACLAFLVGMLTLIEHLFGLDLGIDQVFVQESLTEAGQSFPGRMGPATCISFMLIGCAEVLMDYRAPRGFWPAPYLAAASLPITFLAALAYFYGAQPISALTQYISIAFHTVIALLSLCTGIMLARPQREFMPAFIGPSPGAILARRLLPSILILPALLGWLSVLARNANLYGPHFGTAWVVSVLTLAFSAIVWFTARGINRADLDQKKAEEALLENQSVLKTVTNEAHVGLVMVNQERRYVFANLAYSRILGLSNANLIGKRVPDVLASVYEEQIKPRLDRAFAGERVTYELRLPASGSERARFYEVIYEPRNFATADTYVVVVLVDVTERKLIQETLERTVEERTAELREIVSELEAFSYSVSHDMRAPLRAITGYAMILESDYSRNLPAEAKAYIKNMASAANRMDQLIVDVLAYSRVAKDKRTLTPIDLNSFIQEIISHYPSLQAPNADIQLQKPLAMVLADEPSLGQCISNLLTNAVKFTAPGTKPAIRIWSDRAMPLPSAPAEAGPKVDGNAIGQGMVRICFQDNGIGIAEKDLNRIFGMFERAYTESTYEGTGIGLAIVKKAVERMGGKVGAQSVNGNGSLFWLELKAA